MNTSSRELRVCLDLDGVICEVTQDGNYMSVLPLPGVREALRAIKARGGHIIIYTARRMKTHGGDVAKVIADIGELTRRWLADNEIPYDDLVFGKPYAHVYVDDLGHRFESWDGLVDVIWQRVMASPRS